MKQSRLLALVFGTLAVLGTALAVVKSDSKEAQVTPAYAGQQTCMTAGCHADSGTHIYTGAAAYKKTSHANIHNRPNPQNVLIDRWFREGRTLKYWESRVQAPPGDTIYVDLKKGELETDYLIQMRTVGPNADSTGWLKVAYNYGGNGWLQRFLVQVDGSYYTMPFQYVLPHYREKNTDTGKIIFTDQSRWWEVANNVVDFYSFKSNKFLKESWDKRCTACHVNGFDVDSTWTFKPKSGGGQDTLIQWFSYWVGVNEDSAISDQNIAIGCESCHGPGSAHVADPTNTELQAALSPKRWDPAETSTYATDRKLDICNQCHNRHSSTMNTHTYQFNDAAEEPFVPGPGNELKDYVRDLKKDANYWEDGVTSYAHHQTGQDYWRSKHYTGHVFKNGCYDCHSPHNDVVAENGETLPYQLNRNWYSLQKGEGCVAFGCHAEKANVETRNGEVFNLHAQHLNKHSQCVNCHYTKTQTITFAGSLEFSDHSDKVIRPTVTKAYKTGILNGVLNTCASECHRNGYGERNRPDAFDGNMSIRWGGGELPAMRAPDFGITDKFYSNWRNPEDMELADSLWYYYQIMYNISSVERKGEASSMQGAITSVSPNPAQDVVRIRFELPKAEKVRLEVYDAQGRMIRLLVDLPKEAGAYEAEWEGENELSVPVPSGLYFIRLVGESFTSAKSVMFTR